MESEFFLTRHSKSSYGEYDKILKSENPQVPFEHNKQEDLDLTEAGIKLAQEKAKDFFDRLNPKEDRLFFITSNEARAIGTANIYRLEAKSRGFEIIKPEHTRSNLAEKEGEGELRAINSLSLNPKNMLQFSIFSPDEPKVDWSNVDDEFKERWQKARKVIELDNKDTYGANFAEHSSEIEKILPEVETVEQYHNKNFLNILRLIRWADKKIKSTQGKRIKVLAFGHENYLIKFLQDEFSQEGIQNCETIQFDIDENLKIQAGSRGQKTELKT